MGMIRASELECNRRYNEAHVKVFEEARAAMMLMVDISGSESFVLKINLRKILLQRCSNYGFSATQNNDKMV
jgi:hypothetical protein